MIQRIPLSQFPINLIKDIDIENAYNWFKSFISDKDWVQSGIGDESDPIPPIQNDPHSPKLNCPPISKEYCPPKKSRSLCCIVA